MLWGRWQWEHQKSNANWIGRFFLCFSVVFCGVRDTAAWKLNWGQRRNQWGRSMQLYLWLYETQTDTHTQSTQKEKQPAKQANPHVVLALGLQPGPRWWEVSALTPPSLLCYNKTCGLKCLNKTLENSQNNSLYHSGLIIPTVEHRKRELGWLELPTNSNKVPFPLDFTPLFSHFYMVNLNLGSISTVSRVRSLILPSFGGWVWAHFPEQRLVIEPNLNSNNLNSLLTWTKFPFPWSKSHWKLPPITRVLVFVTLPGLDAIPLAVLVV